MARNSTSTAESVLVTWDDDRMAMLGLGTAQWGNAYGITNTSDRMSDTTCADVIEAARSHGITSIDTALHYGDAQTRLRPWAEDFAITTKVSGLNVDLEVQECLAELNVREIQHVLIRDWDRLSRHERSQAVGELRDLLEHGVVNAVGVSIYDEADIVSALEVFGDREVHLGVIQVPGNVLDRRLDKASVIADLQTLGTYIQLRSVFLQGLLAQSSGTALGKHPHVHRFHSWCRETIQAPIHVALAHAKSLSWIDEVIVGVTSGDELETIAEVWSKTDPISAPLELASHDLDLIDPRRW